MARPPKPTKLKLIQGNPGKRKLNEDEADPELTNLDPPDGWQLTPIEREEWDRTAEKLSSCGLLTDVDKPALALMCQHYGTYIDSVQRLRQSGLLLFPPHPTDENGQPVGGVPLPVANPLVKIGLDQSARLKVLMTEFGMTPASRSRVTVSEKREPSTEWDGI